MNLLFDPIFRVQTNQINLHFVYRLYWKDWARRKLIILLDYRNTNTMHFMFSYATWLEQSWHDTGVRI